LGPKFLRRLQHDCGRDWFTGKALVKHQFMSERASTRLTLPQMAVHAQRSVRFFEVRFKKSKPILSAFAILLL